MKLIQVRCAICLVFYNSCRSHCPQCGSIRIGKLNYQIASGLLMARAIPIPLEKMLNLSWNDHQGASTHLVEGKGK